MQLLEHRKYFSISNAKDGGFVVFEERQDLGVGRAILFASTDIDDALNYIRHEMTEVKEA